MALDNYVRFRCSDDDRKSLAFMAQATEQTESEVFRQLVKLGSEIVAIKKMRQIAEAEETPVVLSMNDKDADAFFRSVLLLGELLASAGKTRAYKDILEVLFGNAKPDLSKVMITETISALEQTRIIIEGSSQKELAPA